MPPKPKPENDASPKKLTWAKRDKIEKLPRLKDG